MTIVAAYIPTPEGDAALRRAIAEARHHGSTLVVLNAARGEAALEPRRLYDDQAEELRSRLDAEGITYELRREVQPREHADQVLDLAEEVGAQMIVIGLRRRSATGKLLFGSTAQTILLGAACPVLAVKA